MSKRTQLLGMCLLLFSVLLAACGGDGSSGSSSELTMWTWKVAHIPGLQAIADDFKSKTGITVKVSAYNPDDAYRTKLTTAGQSEQLPDILSYWSGSQWDLAASGLLQDLTGKVDNSWQANFLPGTYTKSSVLTQSVFDSCKKDPKCTYKNLKVGQSFSVPYMAGQAYFVYANKTILQQAGLNPNTLPKTAEEWMDMMKAVKSKTGKAGLVTGVKNTGVLENWLYRPLMMTSCGLNTYDAIYNGKDSFANPCSMRVLNWMNEIATNKLWIPDILNTDIDPGDTAFSQGKAAFDIGGTYTLSFLLQQGMKASDIIPFPVPALKGSVYSDLKIGAVSLIDAGISQNTTHFDQALQFLKFMTSSEEMAKFAKIVGDLPAVKISTDPAVVGPVLPGLLKGISADSPFNESQAMPKTDMQNVFDVGLQQFITGETTPSALAQKTDKANQAAWKAAGGS
ncbi:ABC transporter substrate-binding protein [Ktedonospora formicarum]|uniref:Sugar ABC transporter substrate-binding protein n=1 Tax=Ktedonospora formicarum TaxID=2778364 RepID=A0A8J3I3E3_9CHLR|nr:ABC transporter substrate-binding protein [Ktedonospora formicarum]GHO46013.1 sugar ABC transporter substrate-binding protein [Ktedonospora formicarum]